MAKKTSKLLTTNVSVNLYDGQFDVCLDCIGPDKCAHARFYTYPPEPDDECSCWINGGCRNAQAYKATLELVRSKINSALAEMEEEP